MAEWFWNTVVGQSFSWSSAATSLAKGQLAVDFQLGRGQLVAAGKT